MEALIQRGPITIMLVYSTSCPHCHTYMPLWKQLCRQRQRKANMVSMEAGVYEQTPMAAKRQVTGVPIVLFVDKAGRITEGEDIRNKRLMTTAVQRGVSEEQLNSPSQQQTSASSNRQILTADSPIFTPKAASPSSMSDSSSMTFSESSTPGTRVRPNPLPAIPAQVVPSPQVGGGSPWTAFLAAAAQQAGPAIALLGAYGMMPKRSSGLGPARRTRRRHPRRT
jgi:hypothetical protein